MCLLTKLWFVLLALYLLCCHSLLRQDQLLSQSQRRGNVLLMLQRAILTNSCWEWSVAPAPLQELAVAVAIELCGPNNINSPQSRPSLLGVRQGKTIFGLASHFHVSSLGQILPPLLTCGTLLTGNGRLGNGFSHKNKQTNKNTPYYLSATVVSYIRGLHPQNSCSTTMWAWKAH